MVTGQLSVNVFVYLYVSVSCSCGRLRVRVRECLRVLVNVGMCVFVLFARSWRGYFLFHFACFCV